MTCVRVWGAPRQLALATLLTVMLPSTAFAIEGGLAIRWGYDFGYGSKKLVESSQLGFPNDRRSITASEGEFFTFGFSLIDDKREFGIDATVGVKSATLCDVYYYDGSSGDSAWLSLLWPTCAWDATLNAEFSRVPLDLIATYNAAPGLRLGAGVTYQLAPELSVSAPLANYKILFDNALGYIVEIDIGNPASRGESGYLYLGLRYTWLTYRINRIEAARANGFGLFVGLTTR